MARPKNQWEAEAAAAAERIDAARAAGQQLALFPGDAGAEDAASGGASGVRGKGKAVSALRDVLAARGCRMPEDVLANVAGLDDPEGLIMACLKKAEAVALAIYGHAQASSKVKLDLFQMFYADARRAAEALLPYGLAKITPDVAVQQAVQVVVMPGSQAASGAQPGPQSARDVTPQARKLAPPPMPWEMQQNQQVADAEVSQSGLSDRTEGPKR